jgi:Na+/glutamate symporter
VKGVVRAAGAGFGATLGVVAAVMIGGAVASFVTRAAVKKYVTDGVDALLEQVAAVKAQVDADEKGPDS